MDENVTIKTVQSVAAFAHNNLRILTHLGVELLVAPGTVELEVLLHGMLRGGY
jgi:hypothetical protein